MRKNVFLKAALLFGTIASYGSIAATEATPEYFPPKVLDEAKHAFGTALVLETYARTLHELGESSIYKSCGQTRGETYRFLYLSEIGGERIVVTLLRDGVSRLTGKAVGLRPAYQLESKADLSDEDWKSLAGKIAAVLSLKEKGRPEKSIVDADNLVFESCKANSYQMIYRWLPTEDAAGQELLNLGEALIRAVKFELSIRPTNVVP